MIKELIKYPLDSKRTSEFFIDNLEGANALCSGLLKHINFEKGVFFTLLPNDANSERTHEFKAGLVLPQNPEQEYFRNGKRCTYSEIPTIREEITEYILQKMKSDKKLCCIFDDVTNYPEDRNHDEIVSSYGLIHDNRIYYRITNHEISKELIRKCLEQSHAIWHSLCVLTTAIIPDDPNRHMSLETIQDITANTQQIILGAYDSEGYVFWERR